MFLPFANIAHVWKNGKRGFESHSSLNFFRIYFHNYKHCVYNGDDLSFIKTDTVFEGFDSRLGAKLDQLWRWIALLDGTKKAETLKNFD